MNTNTPVVPLPIFSEASLSAAHPRPHTRVLFAMPSEEEPAEALQRAYTLAQAMGGELFVVSVLSGKGSPRLLWEDFSEMLRTIDTGRGTLQSTRWLCDRMLPSQISSDNIMVRQGGFLPTVVEVASEYHANLIVLPESEGKDGHKVTKLARLAQVPVLVARAPRHPETILAASDLQSTECPVLKRADQLSKSTKAPLILVHNAQTTHRATESSGEHPLQQAVINLPPDMRAVLLSVENTVDAILTTANEKDADLIVVGTNRRGWFHNLLSPGIAAQVAQKANRSVLIDPLG